MLRAHEKRLEGGLPAAGFDHEFLLGGALAVILFRDAFLLFLQPNRDIEGGLGELLFVLYGHVFRGGCVTLGDHPREITFITFCGPGELHP